MKDHFRFSVAYWHTMRGTGSDPFGPGTMLRPWESGSDDVDMAQKRVRVAFEFMEKLTTPFFCFHDRDIAPEGASLAETNKNLDAVVKVIKEEMQRTGIKLLWGTANLFSNPRYVHGAATSPNADSFAFASAQVKKALEVTKELGGEGYTFWGGREGYQTLWNTDMKREFDHLAKFMHMAVDYAKQIGFKGQFYFEPKPKEPTKHQYDYDCGGLHQLPPRLRPGRPREDEHRNEPCHAGRAFRRARDGLCRRKGSSVRSTPTRATCSSAGTPTSSPPTST